VVSCGNAAAKDDGVGNLVELSAYLQHCHVAASRGPEGAGIGPARVAAEGLTAREEEHARGAVGPGDGDRSMSTRMRKSPLTGNAPSNRFWPLEPLNDVAAWREARLMFATARLRTPTRLAKRLWQPVVKNGQEIDESSPSPTRHEHVGPTKPSRTEQTVVIRRLTTCGAPAGTVPHEADGPACAALAAQRGTWFEPDRQWSLSACAVASK
jgi:hypothetical protein